MTFVAAFVSLRSILIRTTVPAMLVVVATAGVAMETKEETLMVQVNGTEVEVQVAGEGTPVLLVHGAFFKDFLKPLRETLAASGKFRVISWTRRGYDRKPSGPVGIKDHVADGLAVLDHLGVDKAHVAGHSSGGTISLALTAQAPERVASLTLMEPVLFRWVPSAPAYMEEFGGVFGLYEKGQREEALLAAIKPFYTSDHKKMIDTHLPEGTYQLALDDLDTFFQVEMPGLGQWMETFDPEASVAKLKVPVQIITGSNTMPVFLDAPNAVSGWLPGTKKVYIPGGMHMSPISHTKETAAAITAFITTQ